MYPGYPQITWQPWAVFDDVQNLYPGGSSGSQYRFLLEGPVGRAWFLGERFQRQVWGYNSQDPPAVPPPTMRTADRLSAEEVIRDMQGTDALLYFVEGDYATYRRIYLMSPWTGVRAPPLRSAGAASSSRARAADIPSSSRAGASRGRGSSIPPIPPSPYHPGWPDMPTELMSWQYGTTSPTLIPIEPPAPGHRYVSDPDSPPVCSTIFHLSHRHFGSCLFIDDLSLYLQPPREYVDQMLEMVASLEGMVLRREAQMSIMGFQVPFISLAFIIFVMTCWF